VEGKEDELFNCDIQNANKKWPTQSHSPLFGHFKGEFVVVQTMLCYWSGW
jgi:hypothetical protein